MKEKLISTGVFPDHEHANRALTALEDAGFDEDQIGYVSPRSSDLTGEVTDEKHLGDPTQHFYDRGHSIHDPFDKANQNQA